MTMKTIETCQTNDQAEYNEKRSIIIPTSIPHQSHINLRQSTVQKTALKGDKRSYKYPDSGPGQANKWRDDDEQVVLAVMWVST